MNRARIEAAARRADLAIAELAEALRDDERPEADVIEGNRDLVAFYVGLALRSDGPPRLVRHLRLVK